MLQSTRAARAAAEKADPALAERIFSRDLDAMAAAADRALAACDPDIVFAHNDLQEGNIMRLPDGTLQFIDFEYVSYNYSAYDLANHLAEWTNDYSNPDPPYFWYREEDYPSETHRRLFVETYLSERHGHAPAAAAVEAMLRDIARCTLAVHFIWALWGVKNCTSPIPFCYLEFTLGRLAAFDHHLVRA
jgi:thiamine kinase-like enzyme